MDKTMHSFFEQSLGREEIPTDASQGHKVYEALVHHRFYEVITHAFPLLSANAPKQMLEDAIVDFVKHAPSTPYIWQVPFYFWKFVQEHKSLDLPYVDDLLWYEWSEIELMMEVYEPLHVSTFSWETHWEIHPSVRLRKLSYRVFESNLEEKGEWFLLAWYDTKQHTACYKEIGEVLYTFLEALEHKSFEQSMQMLIDATQSDQKTIKNYLNDALVSLCFEGIIRIKENL